MGISTSPECGLLLILQLRMQLALAVAGAHCWLLLSLLPTMTPRTFSAELPATGPFSACTTARGPTSHVQDFTFVFAEFDKTPAGPIPSAGLDPSTLNCIDCFPPSWCHLQT